MGDRVVVRILWDGLGHGPTTNLEMTVLATVREGQIHYVEYLWDYAAARAALGLGD